MEYHREITVVQATAILSSTIIGVGVLALPRFAVEAGDTGAPLVTLLGILLAFIGLWLITILGMRFPNQSLIQYSETVIGKISARFASFLIILFFAILTALTAREFGEVVVTSVLRRTPLEVTVIAMLILAMIPTRNNITVFAYIHHFYLPLMIAPALLIVILSLQNANPVHLQPLWPGNPSGMLRGTLTIAALFQGSFIMSLVIPAMRRPRKAIRASFWGMLIAGGVYFLTVVAAVAVFGPEEIKLLRWPMLDLARSTSIPGNVIERVDAPFLIVWVTAVFTTLFSSYYLTIHSISELFRMRDHKMYSLFVLPFIFLIAMLPENLQQLYSLIEVIGKIGLLLTIGYPLFLLVVALIRKRKGSPS